MALDKAGIDLGRGELRVGGDPREKAEIGRDAEHRSLGEGAAQPAKRRRAVLSPDDDLGDHRIVERRYRIPLPHAGIDAGDLRRRAAADRCKVPVCGRNPRPGSSA